MSVDAEDFLVFETYKDAPGHAFSKGVVSEADKDSYERVFQHLRSAVAGAIARSPAAAELDDWNCRFGRDGGVQGQRPVDLWASIINRDSDAFSRFPQVYVIASENGVEVGFSVTIHEDDYFNAELKRKNRSIVPLVNAKLPSPTSELAQEIQNVLSSEQGWHYGEKARQGPVSSFADFPAVISYLKGQGSPRGGGSVYRFLGFEEVAEGGNRLENELVHVLELFLPVMRMLRPTAIEAGYAANMVELAEQAEQVPPFVPDDEEDGRRKVLREVAVRQGQAKFRDDLVQAYSGTCAVSGCAVAPTLQAAHVAPYNGPKSNHVSNGILLRADIHTLFDLGLLKIDPETRAVSVVASLVETEYAKYAGHVIADPAKPSQRPSKLALAKKLEKFPAG
ncbi:HNH endonuclease [Qipengyuania sp. CAU 1752]